MTTISKLNSVDSVSDGDLLPIYSTPNSDTRKASLALLSAYFQSKLAAGKAQTQYAAPSANGFSIIIQPAVNGADVHALITPTGVLSGGTITLPDSNAAVDKQSMLVTTTFALTALTFVASGSIINGAPSMLGANCAIEFAYDKITNAWYCISDADEDTTISVTQFITTAVDGVTSNQTGIEAAVTEAIARGSDLYWPPGTYVSDANIPNFHSVRHVGSGVLKRGASIFTITPKEANTNDLFVSPTGSASNDGLSSSQPMTVPVACAALENFGPLLDGRWRVRHAAGTYPASSAAQILDLLSRVRIEFIGPDVAFSVPTAIYDMTGAATTYALWFGGRMQVKIADLKFINCTNGGSLAGALVLDNGPNAWARNVHIDNCPGYAFNANINTRILIEGGTYNNCQYAIKIYNSVATIGYNAQRLSVTNCTVGILIQKAYSHTDYVDYSDCATALQSQLGAHTTNYFCTFNNVARTVDVGATSTVSTENATYTGTTVVTRRARTGPFSEDSETTYRFENQFHTVGTNGRSSYGYTDWVVPTVKFQYSNNGTNTGFNLSSFASCTALWESSSNTIIGLASPDASFTALWFGDSTSARRAEFRQTGGVLNLAFSNVSYFRFRSTDIAPQTDNTITNGTATLRWSNMYAYNVTLKPPASVTPANNGDMTFELTSDTQLKIKVKGSDGVVRSVSLTLA